MRTPTITQNLFAGQLRRFRDADTVITLLRLPFNVLLEMPVRLARIDSWELDSPDRARALSAAATLNAAFAGREVLVRPHRSDLDCYGRIAASIVLDGHDLAALIVGRGLAWWIDRTNPPPARGLFHAGKTDRAAIDGSHRDAHCAIVAPSRDAQTEHGGTCKSVSHVASLPDCAHA